MIRDIFSSRIQTAITKKSVDELSKQIVGFVDRNANILLTLNLTDRYSFGTEERNVIYNFLSVREEEIENALKTSKYINKSNRNHNNPFYHACILASHFFLM